MNLAPDLIDSKSSTTPLHKRAEDNLEYIRDSMERATSFTAVSGKAYVVAGVSALIATWLAEQQTSESLWLAVWMIELLTAASLLLVMTSQKAQRQGEWLLSTSGKKLLFAFFPAMVAGGILTLAFFLQGQMSWLPGVWLSLYGAAVMTAGAHSVSIIPVMGAAFLLLGAVVLLANLSSVLALSLGMGGLHIVFGLLVWRNHGG